MDTDVITLILKELLLKRLIPVLETFETGAEMQTRPWLLALIASWSPLATQCLENADGPVYLKAEVSEGLLNEVRDLLRSSMSSEDLTAGQFMKDEDSSLWKGQHKADVTTYAYRKEALAAGEFLEELAAKLVTLIIEAKDSLGKDKLAGWINKGRYQNSDYCIRGALWNAENTGEPNIVFGMGTDVERFAPSCFRLENLIKVVDNKVVSVPDKPIFLDPNPPVVTPANASAAEATAANAANAANVAKVAALAALVAKARSRVHNATGKNTIPDGVYPVGKLYMTQKVAWFLRLPLPKQDPTIVQRETLAFVQGLSIMLCGKRAKKWTVEHVHKCLAAYEAHLKKEVEQVEVHGAAKETFDASYSAF